MKFAREKLLGAAASALALSGVAWAGVPLTRPDVFTNSLCDVIVQEGGENPIVSATSFGSWSFKVAETGALMEYDAGTCMFAKSGIQTLKFQANAAGDNIFFHPGPSNNMWVEYRPDGPCVCRLSVEAWSETTGWADGVAISIVNAAGETLAGPVCTVQSGAHLRLMTDEVTLPFEGLLKLVLDRQGGYGSDGTRMIIRQIVRPIRPIAVTDAVHYADGIGAKLSLSSPTVEGEVLKVCHAGGEVVVGTVSAASEIGLTPGRSVLAVEVALPTDAAEVRFVLADGETERISEALPIAQMPVLPRPAPGELAYGLQKEPSPERTLAVSAQVTWAAGEDEVRLTAFCTDGGAATNVVTLDGTFAALERGTAQFAPVRPNSPYQVWFEAECVGGGTRWVTQPISVAAEETRTYLAGARTVAVDSMVRTQDGELEKIVVSLGPAFSCEEDELYLMWGDRDCGDDIRNWLNVRKVATVKGSVNSVELADLPSGWGTAYRVLRVALRTRCIPASCYVQRGLLAMWDGIENAGAGARNDAATTWIDQKGGYNAAYSSGTPTWSGGGGAQIVRSPANYFAATGCGTLATAMGDVYTVEAVATPDSGWKNNYSGIAGNHGNGMKGVCFGQWNAGNVAFNLGNDNVAGLGSVKIPELDLPLGRLTTFSLDENLSAISLYLDGSLYGTAANGTTYTPGLSFSTFYLGRAFNNSDRNFSGVIHCTRIYAGNLTPAERAQNRQVDEIRFGTRDDIVRSSCSDAVEWQDMATPVVRTGEVVANEDLTVSVGWVAENLGDGADAANVYAVYRSRYDLAWTTNLLASGVTADGSALLSEQLRSGTDYEITLLLSNTVGRISALSSVKRFAVPAIEDFATTIGRTVTVVGRTEEGGVLTSVRVAVGAGAVETELFAAYGKGFAGLSTNGWDRVVKVADVPAEGGEYDFAIPSGWGVSVCYLKFFADVTPTPTSLTYPQGLVAAWDGIDNAGLGAHVSSGTVWKSVVGEGFDLEAVGGDPIWTESGWLSQLNACRFPMSVEASAALVGSFGQGWTIEAAVTPASDWIDPEKGNYPGIVGSQNSGIGIGLGQSVHNDKVEFVAGNQTIMVPMSCFAAGRTSLLTMSGSSAGAAAYVDGVLQGASVKAATIPAATRFFVGITWNPSYPAMDAGRTFAGTIHAVRVYSRALTADDVKTARRIDSARYLGAALTNFMGSSSAVIEAPLIPPPKIESLAVSNLGAGGVAVLTGRLADDGATNDVEVTVRWGTDPAAPDHEETLMLAATNGFAALLTGVPVDGVTPIYYDVTATANGMFDRRAESKVVVDTAVYTWCGGATGRWADARNWTASVEPNLGWPQGAAATAKFTSAATVDLDVPCVTNKALSASAAVTLRLARDSGGWRNMSDSVLPLLAWTTSTDASKVVLGVSASAVQRKRARMYFTDSAGTEISSATGVRGLAIAVGGCPGMILILR